MTRLAAAGFLAALASATMVVSPSLAAAPQIPSVKPAAPGPTYLTAADKSRLLSVVSALKSRDFSTARSITALIPDPIAKGLGQWMYLMAEDPAVDFREADAFLDGNPDWPMRDRIHAFVEKRIPNSAPANDVLAFFDTRPPVTGEGKLQLARALLAVGDKQGAERLIRDGWVNDDFTVTDETRLLSLYGNRLTAEDHKARADRLLWGRQVTNARRVFPSLARDDRRAAEARAALLLGASGAAKLYNALPEETRLDSGMLHAATRYYRRAGSEPFAIALAKLAPKDPALLRNSGRWWEERQLLMRWALKNGRFADAYSLAAENGLTGGADYADAEYYAGWIALRFLNDPQRAETHFLAMASEVGSPISVSRAQYWLGRAARAKGDQESAQVYFERAAQHYYSYYGQLAAEEIGEPASAARFAAISQSTPADRALFASRPTVAALRMLSDLDLDYEFMVFAYHVDDQLERPGEYIELAKLTNGEGAPHLTVRAGKVGIQRGAFAPDVAYPVVFVPDEAARFIAPEVILGLSRQESEFNPRAYSRAGARGVMQLIPTTAQITARKEGMLYNRNALLDDPSYNMVLGAAHLSHLLDRFDGSLIMTFAAYNAGAARVDQWINEYGDPRSANADPLDWVELIPFSETRNYVQRVLENVQVYRGRLNDAPIPGQLRADLERGGPQQRTARGVSPALVLANASAPFRAEEIAPVPEATRMRARKYASDNPLKPPPVAQTDPASQATDASPIALNNKAAKKSDRKRASGRKSRAPASEESAPILDEPILDDADAMALADNADIAPPTLMLLDPAPVNADAGPPSPLALDEPVRDASDGLETGEDAAPPMLEAVADDIGDLSVAETDAAPGGDLASCLTYRNFLAANAEEDAEAADLNAGMLAELQSGQPVCQ